MKGIDDFESEQLLCLLAALLIADKNTPSANSKVKYGTDGCVEVNFNDLNSILKTSIGIDKISGDGLRFYLHSRGVAFKSWA
jgi:hypothetical protein